LSARVNFDRYPYYRVSLKKKAQFGTISLAGGRGFKQIEHPIDMKKYFRFEFAFSPHFTPKKYFFWSQKTSDW